MFYTSIVSIELSGDIADYGMDATLDTIESYKEFLKNNTNADVTINYDSNVENWEFKSKYLTLHEQDVIKSRLWDQFCSQETNEPKKKVTRLKLSNNMIEIDIDQVMEDTNE